MLLVVRHGERRLLDRLEGLDDRVAKLDEKIDKVDQRNRTMPSNSGKGLLRPSAEDEMRELGASSKLIVMVGRAGLNTQRIVL